MTMREVVFVFIWERKETSAGRKLGALLHADVTVSVCVGLKGSEKVLQPGSEGQCASPPEAGPGCLGHPGGWRTALCLLPDGHGG